MGATKGSHTLYHLNNLTLADIAAMTRGLFNEMRGLLGLNMSMPTIDGDSNNICQTVARKSDTKSSAVAEFYCRWSHGGIQVVPVVDGDVRPTCKQATIERKGKREKNRIEGFMLMKEVNKIKSDIANGLVPSNELEEKRIMLFNKEKTSRTKLAASEDLMPGDFAEALEDAVINDVDARIPNQSGGFVASVLKANFQADAAIIDRFLNKEAIMAITRDSDMPIIAGDDFMAIKDFTKDGSMTMVSTSKATLENAIKYLPEESKEMVKLVDAVCPIFEGVKTRKLRALMMVALGCDVYKPGVKGVGPKKLRDQMNKLKEKFSSDDRENEDYFFNDLLKHMGKMTHLGTNVIHTFVKGIIYEPTNYVSCDSGSVPYDTITEADHTYFDGSPPNTLPEYLFDMASAETTVDEEGPAVVLCKGVGGDPHMLLSKTGWNKCHGCNRIVCGFCSDNIKDCWFCLHCYAAESLVPSRESGYTGRIAIMRKELKDIYRFDGADELQHDEVEDVYECAVEEIGYHNELQSSVKYPLHPTSELENPTHWKEIYELNFSNGGTFITDQTLKQHVPGILNLFASFVKYETKKYTSHVKDSDVYDALPKMFIEFAENSRIDSGYRLLERCVRHGHDPKMQSIFYNKAKLIEVEDGSLGIVIKTKVPASMRDKVYTTTIAHTAADILAVECNCKAGSKDDDDIVCVHNLPIAYKVTQLLLEDMAEHLLLELTSCLASLIEDWSGETLSWVKQSVIILMEAAGETVSDEDKRSITLDALLDIFLTGTEKIKAWGKQNHSAKASQQGPITQLCLSSPAKKAKELKNKNKIEKLERKANEDETEANDMADVPAPLADDNGKANYIQSTLLMTAAGISVSKFTAVGFRVASLRADARMPSMGVDGMMQLRAKMEKDWEQLICESERRSFRQSNSQLANISKKRPVDCAESDIVHLSSPKEKSNPSSSKHVTPSPQRTLGVSGWKLPTHPPLKISKKSHSWCSRVDCTVNNTNTPSTHFHRIKAYPKPLTKNATKKGYINREGQILLRAELLDRCYFKRGIKEGAYRVCEEHEFEWAVKSRKLSWKGKNWTQLFNLYVPKGDGAKSTMCQDTAESSRGTANDRAVTKLLEHLNKQIASRPKAPSVDTDELDLNNGSSPMITTIESANNKLAVANADAAESRKAVQQMAEENCPDPNPNLKLNPAVAREAGLPCDSRVCPPVKTPNKTFFNAEARITPRSKTEHKHKQKSYAANQSTKVRLGWDDSEVKRRTGFKSESMMLAYIFVVCGGEVDLIRQRCSSLTWYEEWFFHFEWKWGRTLTRWEDAEKDFDIIPKYLRSIHRRKLSLERRCRRLWPTFLSYDDDVRLRKPRWRLKYRTRNDGKKIRPIMWDMTGVKAYAFGAADAQRNTYSKYYAGNCFKGGIGVQLSGYLVTYDLWGGNVSDTDYNKRAGYLEEQSAFQKNDLVDGEVLPFTNIYDKGYRARAICWRHDKQLIAQPVFGKSDQRFKGSDTLYSASIASDRGGNERGVNVSKRCGVIKRGFKVGMDTQIFQDNWITWGFQSNFMFNPVL